MALSALLAVTVLLHAKDVFGPPIRPAPALWSSAPPTLAGGAPQAVSFIRDGVTLRGWRFAALRPNAPYVLFFYGSNEDLVHERGRLAWLAQVVGVNAVAYDLRGYGFSEGKVDPEAMRADALAAFDAVSAMAKGAPIVVYGWSVGAEFAIHVAASRAVQGLILQAPPASASAMAEESRRHDVPAVVRGAVRLQHDADVAPVFSGAAEIRGVSAPLLVIQGSEDDVVGIDQGRAVFAASPSTHKTMVVVPGVHHNDLRYRDPPAGPAMSAFVTQFVGRTNP